MKPKKNPKTDLNRNRGLYFVMGLAAVMALAYVALEWKTYQDPFEFTERLNVSDPLDEPVIQVDFKLPPPPKPPVAPDALEIVPDDEPIIETVIEITEPVDDEPIPVDAIPNTEKAIDAEIPITAVEEKPIFPGCENEKDKLACFQTKMQKHIQKNFRYPELEQDMGIQGRVSVMFTIQKDGSIGNLRMRGPNKNLEKEAARIIGKLPKIQPGKQAGKPVRIPFSIPITFKLQ